MNFSAYFVLDYPTLVKRQLGPGSPGFTAHVLAHFLLEPANDRLLVTGAASPNALNRNPANACIALALLTGVPLAESPDQLRFTLARKGVIITDFVIGH
jgi:hypothetical protein